MATKDEFLSLKDKNQSFTNDVSHTDKSGQYSNLNLNQNQNSPTLIPVLFSNNPKNDKYCATFKSQDFKVPDKYDERGKSDARNKSAGLCSHTFNLNDKTEEEAKKKWKKGGLSDANSSTFSLHISAYENSKEVAALDILNGENVELKRNKTNMNNLMIQNPFEFPRQQEEDQLVEPEVMGFKANQRLLDPNQPTSPNNAQEMVNLYGNGTQGLSTQSSTNHSKFINWCKAFVQEYERRFVNPEQEITEKAEKKFRDSFIQFLEPNLADDGKRYKSMFKNFVSYSRHEEDKGDLFHKFMPALFTLMEKYDADKNHQVQLLSNFLKIFEVENLDSDLVCDLEILYKEEVKKLADGANNIREIYRQTSILFNNEEITKKRSIKLYVWLSTLRTQGIANKKIFEKLLDECSHKSINGVVGVICDDDQIEVFHSYAKKFLTAGFSKDSAYQKLGFAKITACLRNFTESQIHDILTAFCDAWREMDSSFFIEIGDEIVEFTDMLHRHPLVGKAAVKVFKKHKKYVRSSTFGLICQIALISSYRYEAEVSKMFSLSLSKIWQFADNLETDGWIYTVIKDLKLRDITDKFTVINEFIQGCRNAANALVRGLTVLSIQLMESSSKKASFNIINGKLEHIENDIAFVGRRILVNTIESVPIESDNKHSSEPLQALITAICSNATKIPNVYFFIDVLVELRKTRSSMLVMNWEIFDKLVRHICDIPSEVGVKVMSALMPVIIQRSGMRKAIFTSLRTEMVSVSKVSTALPVMFQLLRSLIEQPEAKAAFQCSQSFASFSSQLAGSQKKETGAVLDAIPIFECIKRCMHQSPATKCLVYKGIVDICKKNNYFVMHGLDLLLHELTSLPELKISAYMDKTSDGYNYVKYQCPQLLKATHAVLSAASFAYENVPQYAQTQLSQNGVDIISKAHSALENYINSVIGVHLEDLKMDKANEDLKNETTKTSYYGMFGIMLLQLYDVIIECLWKFNSDDTNDEALNNIEDLISRRKALSELVETKKKSEKDPNNKDESVEVPKLIVQDLQIDIPKLSAMLEDLDSPEFENRASTDGISLKDKFLPWIFHRIHDSVSLLNPKTSTCLSSLKSLTSMACALLKFYSSKEPESSTDAVIKAFAVAQTKAVESYNKILLYILSKYQGKCSEPLKEIFEKVISVEYGDLTEYPQYTQIGIRVAEVAEIEISHTDGDNLNAAGYNTDFRIYSSKHIAAYYQKILPAIFANRQSYERKKVLNEYHKQICSFLSVARKLSSMLTSSSNLIRTSIMDIILEIAEKHDIGDKNAAVDFWKGVLEIIAHSNCDDKWIEIFNNLVHFSICLVTGQTDDPSVYKSLKPDIAPQFYVAVTRTLSYLLSKVRTAINAKNVNGDIIYDSFLVTVCCIVEKFAENILTIVKIDDELVTKNEQMVTATLEMLTDFYATLNCIAQEFKTKINNKVEIDGWESLLAFDRVIGEVTDKIVKESANKFGCGKYSLLQAKSSKSSKSPKTPKVSDLTKTSKAKKPSKPKKPSDKPKKTEEEIAEAKAQRQHDEMVRRNKKDEKLFIRLEKEFETFHNTLLFIEEKCGTQDCPLTLPAAEDKAMRVFHIDEGALNQVFCDNDESGEEEVEQEEEEEAERNENDASEEENDASEEDKRKTDDSDKSSDSE